MGPSNLAQWFGGSQKNREFAALREGWERTQRAWHASPIGNLSGDDPVGTLALEINQECWGRHRTPNRQTAIAIGQCIAEVLSAEAIGNIAPLWDAIEGDVSVAVHFRGVLTRRTRYAVDFERVHGTLKQRLFDAFDAYFEALPSGAFDREGGSFDVPLVELLDRPADLIQEFLNLAYSGDLVGLGLLADIRDTMRRNLCIASGLPPDTQQVDRPDRIIYPHQQRGKTPAELVALYLADTPFEQLFTLAVPFRLKEEVRFEHSHIIGGTGHGKTQLMQRMIYADLVRAQREKRSVVVIDSQGDLINRLSRLALFDPDAERSLADRLILIDPADVEFPPSLNLFDAHTERLADYRIVDRERVLNGVVETYENFFGDLLGAELTQKQGVVFKYLARLMLAIPDATIHTLMQLMENPKPYLPYMRDLEGSARYFFETEFFEPAFAQTKKQILRRLWGVLATPAFERMFAQQDNKLDLFEALQDGKIILISTAKDLLKSEGSALFGRFFIGMLAQAALERSTVDLADRTPTMIYVDEAQEYFEDRIETILTQARKYRLGITLAHQSLDQLSPRLRAAIHTNTSIKCVGGVSARDARALSDELHTSSEFLEGMRRKGERTEFAAWIKNETPQAIRLGVPLGFLERQAVASEEAYNALLDANRERYCGTLAEVNEALRALHQRPEEPKLEPPPPFVQPALPITEPLPPPPPPRPPVAGAAPTEEPSVRAPPAPRVEGKGGTQHVYVQHLIKTLAEERGFRAVIEEAVEGGQVDVALRRSDLSIACEISVTSKSAYEAQNLAKCLRAGFTRVWAVAPEQRRVRAIRKAAEERLGIELAGKVEFLTTEEVADRLADFTLPEPSAMTIRGYTVRTSRKTVDADDAAERRRTIARILSKSTGAPSAS